MASRPFFGDLRPSILVDKDRGAFQAQLCESPLYLSRNVIGDKELGAIVCN